MPGEVGIPLAGLVAAAVAFVATPLAIRIAVATDFLDRPTGYKAHAGPTPYLGGVAVIVGFVVAAFAFGGANGHLLPIVAGAVAMWALGTIDDRIGLLVMPRVLGEMAVAALLWQSGLGWSVFASPVLNFALTLLWVVAVVIAFSLLDNIDGATAGLAAVTAAGVGVLAGLHGSPQLAALAAGLSGACAGFLPYNLSAPRASIFLGDGGAMAIGFVVAAATMALPMQSGEALLAAPVLVAVALTDTALVMVSRRRRGVSVLTAGRDHLTHRLLLRLGSSRAVVLTVGGVQALLSGVAIVALELGSVVAVTALSLALALALFTIVTLERIPVSTEQAVEALPAPPGSLESVQAETP